MRSNPNSAHADRSELVFWLSTLRKPPRMLFAIHGESETAEAFSQYVREKLGWKTYIPAYKETVLLE